MSFRPEHLRFVQTQLQIQIELRVQQSWSSKNLNYRETIHNDLKKYLGLAEVDIQNPDFSIAHCNVLGGFASKKKYSPGHIGFDIEEVKRIEMPLAKRICKTSLEFENAPSPSYLWVAKEATYKALRGPEQPQTISELSLYNWRKLHEAAFLFEMKLNDKNPAQHFRGLALEIADLAYAFVHFVPA
jgi:hypothetical protein